MSYPYITENNLFHRQYYNYATCDDAFFLGYQESRSIVSYNFAVPTEKSLFDFCAAEIDGYYNGDTEVFVLRKELETLILSCRTDAVPVECVAVADKLVKTFEVRKRLYHCYNEKMRPYDERDFEDVSLYILFSCAMLLCYRRTNDLKYLNALLKSNDILLSIREKFSKDETLYTFFSFGLSGEKRCVDALMKGDGRSD